MTDLIDTKGAMFSECGSYRYLLWRRWDDRPAMVFLMLNPSTADATHNDPTVERCMRRAMKSEYGALIVLNLFAWRSTNPAALRNVSDPVGPENDHVISCVAAAAGRVICGWGAHGALNGRAGDVLQLLAHMGAEPYCLTTTKCGQPGHPLYVSYDVQPSPYEPPCQPSQR